jgi:aspartyl-tRNA(Asn)/glutamyl-tRNA(Gln) amidotransferase subunit B
MTTQTITERILERYEPVIGLEVHCQLLTESKIFCGCSTRFGAEPNRQVCPICLGHPGVLPVLNRRVVELAVRFAVAVGAQVQAESVFARKNYFYPDLPKGYQISQYELPLAVGGQLTFRHDGAAKTVHLTRVHLEEDAGKLIHAEGEVGSQGGSRAAGSSLVDFNRSGVPLIEIVSEPDLRSPREAHLYLQRLRALVRWLGVSDGNMEEGSLRCDANVSLRPRGTREFGTKTEIKNLNSFRHVERSLAYEIERQADLLERGERVAQETLLWDPVAERSQVMRSKEEAHDYRYFPEPDLLPLRLSPAEIEAARAALPELPEARVSRYVRERGLPEYDAQVLCESRELSDYFEQTVELHRDPKRVANWIMTEVMARLNEKGMAIGDFPVPPAGLADLLDRIAGGSLSGKLAKEVFAVMAETGRPAADIVAERGIEQIADEDAIRGHVRAVVDAHPEQLAKFLAGKEALLQFFMGELMKRTRGRAHPERALALMQGELARRRESS